MAVRLSRLSVAVLLNFIVSAVSLTCPPNSRPLPPDLCLEPKGTPFATFADSRDRCTDESTDGLMVISDDQLPNLVRYAQVIGGRGDFNWLGYIYQDADTLLSDVQQSPVDVSSALLSPGNYGDERSQADPGPGVCIAIGGESGLLYRVTCSELLPSFCQHRIEMPSANITTSADRFVAAGAAISLTCSTSNSDTSPSWMAGTPVTTQPVGISQDDTVIPSFAPEHAGAYYCSASSGLGVYVSEPVVLVVADGGANDSSVPEVSIVPSPAVPQFEAPFTLTCSYTSALPVTRVQWFINGRPVSESSGTLQSNSSLTLEIFQEEGFYQCFVLNENGSSAGTSFLASGQPGLPGPVYDIIVQPNTRMEVFVSWLCPETTSVQDTAFLRYRVYFHEGTVFNLSIAIPLNDVVPVLLTREESADCAVESLLQNLEVGTTYVMKVVAIAPNDMVGGMSRAAFLATTYGTVPGMVEDLKVERSPDNKTVFARWEAVETTPPVGVVARYQIQYRDSEKGSVSVVFHTRKFNYVIILNVINANSYEVRVSAGVIVQRDPVQYEYSVFTKWMKVEGINTNIPTVIPPGAVGPRVGAIAAGVVVGVLVLILVATLLIVGVVCLVVKKGGYGRTLQDNVKFSEINDEHDEARDEAK